jgi:PTH1 family peptidyl-tRNA hydrolase
MLAQALPFISSLVWQKKFNGLYSSHEGIHFLMPETYMNLSGVSVHAAAAFFKVNIEEIIVVHDELELPLGYISLKFSGGLGGHNGLRSMQKSLGGLDFWRLRIGLGRPDSRKPGEGGPEGSGKGIIDWVLSDFTENEAEKLVPVLKTGAELLQQTFTSDPETLLGEWSKKYIALQEPQQHDGK